MSNLNVLENREKQKKTSYKVKKTLYIILSTLVITALLYFIGMYSKDSGIEKPIEYKVIEDVVGFEINSVEFTSHSVGNLDEDIYPVIYLSEKKMVHDIVTKRAEEVEVNTENEEGEETEVEETEDLSEDGTNEEVNTENENENSITTEDSEVEGFEEGVITSNLSVLGLEFDKETGQYLTETVNIGDMQVEVKVGFTLYKNLDTTSIIEEIESRGDNTAETEEGTSETEDNPFGEEEPVETETNEEDNTEDNSGETTEEVDESTEEGEETSDDSLDNLFEDLEEDSAE